MGLAMAAGADVCRTTTRGRLSGVLKNSGGGQGGAGGILGAVEGRRDTGWVLGFFTGVAIIFSPLRSKYSL